MWIGEVRLRNSWWVRRFPTPDAAQDWVEKQTELQRDSVTPVIASAVREKPKNVPLPVAPALPFDQAWPAP